MVGGVVGVRVGRGVEVGAGVALGSGVFVGFGVSERFCPLLAGEQATSRMSAGNSKAKCFMYGFP